MASLWNEYVDGMVEHGTLPVDEPCHALKDGSRDGGAVDVEGMARGAPEGPVANPDRPCPLYRIDAAVSSRQVHAATHDALRLCKGF
ncbi:MAG: hypothetical protein AB7I59_10560 [Geminicoccaceae bacterium]